MFRSVPGHETSHRPVLVFYEGRKRVSTTTTTTKNIRFLWENFSGLASGEFHILRAQRSVRVHSGEDRRPNGERDERSSGRREEEKQGGR